jgi:hypothetical protein
MPDKKDDNADPMADIQNIERAYPNQSDDTGTPDTQPHQPAEALGDGQVSLDSMEKQREEVRKQAEKDASASEKASGTAKVSKEDSDKAEDKAKS